MKAKVYKLGKSEYAIAKPAGKYLVYRLVRSRWQMLASLDTFNEAKLCIFDEFSVQKGMVVI